MPKADEITLSAPEGRRVFLNMSTTLHHRHDARHNVFWVCSLAEYQPDMQLYLFSILRLRFTFTEKTNVSLFILIV